MYAIYSEQSQADSLQADRERGLRTKMMMREGRQQQRVQTTTNQQNDRRFSLMISADVLLHVCETKREQ